MAESGEQWELSKENIRPIQQGRKQKVLKVALAPHPEELISQQRQSYENELRTYSGDDPLFVWCKYIKWVEQNYPKGGREGHIKQLMERCLSILQDEQKYFDDDRFIDIMLKYAGSSGKPLEVYNHMYSNNIGCKSAKFFINWSWELEQMGNLKKADEVLTEGMQRKAQPFDRIKSYYADFEIRLAAKIKASIETNNYESENNRSAFAILKPQKKNTAPILRTGEAVIDKKPSLLLNRQQAQPKSVKSSTKVPFKIYDAENINPSLPIQTQSGARNYLNSENSKENERKPSKWNKVKMKSHGHFNETNPDFKFHCDDEKEDHQLSTPRSVPKTSSILSSRRRTPSPPIALFEPPDPMKKPMYPKNKVYGGAEEYSLEEIRAAAWLERKKKAEKEVLFAKQQKIIEEQAKEKEKLEKQVKYLAKELEMLKNHVTSPCVKPYDILSKPDINKQCEIDDVFENNQREKSSINGEEISQNYKNGSNAESFRYKSVSEQNSDASIYNSANKMIQELYNKSLSYPIDDANTADLSKEFNRKCSILSSNENIFNKLPQTDQSNNITEQSDDKLPFALFHDPTTKIIPNLTNIASSKVEDFGELRSFSKNSDKPSFLFFNDCSTSQKSENLSINQTGGIQSFSNKSKCELPFTFYADPTEKIISEPNKVVSSKPTDSNLNEVCRSVKESNDMPFTFYHDPTISNIANIAPEKNGCKEYLHQELSDENSENIPPKGYVQDNTKRELAGILEPSKNVFYIPLEEQELDEDADESDSEDFIYPEGRPCADETLIPPSNTEQFSTAKFLASTPCVNKPNRIISVKKPDELSTEQVSQNISKPAENLSDKKHFIDNENVAVKPELKTHKELELSSDLKTCNSRLPNILSIILETSENCSKSSSSSSSASLTKSNHSAFQVYKQHSKLEFREPSKICPISEDSSQSFQNTDIKNKIEDKRDVKKSELFSADFDPFDPKITQQLLNSIKFDHYNTIFYNNKSIKNVKINECIEIGNETYAVENLIAEGAYAKVYKANKPFEMSGTKSLALKVCKKANEWEFYICSEIQRRLSEAKLIPDIKDSVMNIIAAIKYTDGLVLVNEFGSLGTLLDIINFYKKQNSAIPELLAMFLTLQILQIVSKLHKCNIIHGDIKPDNFLLTATSDENILGNISKCTTFLRLIDFGRAIDLNQFDKGICFTTVFNTDDLKCNEMKEQKPWVFQLDWYGVLSCIHTLLFQEYMKVIKKDNVWKIEKKFKRYWFNTLWEPLFDKLLNIPECYEEPDLTFFVNIIESKLQQNEKQFNTQLSRFFDIYSKRK